MLQPTEQVAPEVTIFALAVERFCLAEHRTGGRELTRDLPEVSRCLNLIQLKFSEMAAAFAQTDEYDIQGSYSPIHWIRVNCHMGSGAAGDRVAVGERHDEQAARRPEEQGVLLRLARGVEAEAAADLGQRAQSRFARWKFSAVPLDHGASAGVQVAGARVIAEPLP